MTGGASKPLNGAGRPARVPAHRPPRAQKVGILRSRQQAPQPQDDIRQLGDLISIGPAMLRDFELLGIRSVAQLAKQNPQRMYERLGRAMGQRQDPCVLDTFCAAVAQARNPRLPAEQCQWWFWSEKRKQQDKKKNGKR
jgi:hypothetical protein